MIYNQGRKCNIALSTGEIIMKPMPPEKLLRVSDGARELALKESTLRAWILSRRIRVVRIGRRAIRIPMSEVVRLIEEGTVPAREERG